MKNKRIFKTLSALCAALVLMGGFSVTAFAQGPEQPPAEDATNDTNVVEETEDSSALTPEGNAALVDDFGGNKQLITVTTKSGNYFYILIDRANEDKETAVHFLNQVDEADLMALMAIRRETARCLQLHGKMRSRCGQHQMRGVQYGHDRLYRQGTGTAKGTHGAGEKRTRRVKSGCPAAGAGRDGRRCLCLLQIY